MICYRDMTFFASSLPHHRRAAALSFDGAFLGQILLPDGRTVHQRLEASDMLPALEAPK